jgi:dienelactone hydrolase
MAKLRSVLIYLVSIAVLLITLTLIWLRWDASLSRDDWFVTRQGQIEVATTRESVTANGQRAESVQLISDSGLQISFRVIRELQNDAPRPVLLILGGHRTGSRAVELFGDVGSRAIVGVDYPYDGPASAQGIIAIAKMIPLARQAILDTTPAVSLIVDWLTEQVWVDKKRIIIVGASLGVPFAVSAATRDKRINAVMLVHGAADNRMWLETQIARRIESKFLHYPLSRTLHWLAYGPIFNTGQLIAAVAPRPVLIIGARNDERTPDGQAELLFAAAGDPKRLRWTEGQHIQPNRQEVVEELLRIAYEELPFLTQSTCPLPEPGIPASTEIRP